MPIATATQEGRLDNMKGNSAISPGTKKTIPQAPAPFDKRDKIKAMPDKIKTISTEIIPPLKL